MRNEIIMAARAFMEKEQSYAVCTGILHEKIDGEKKKAFNGNMDASVLRLHRPEVMKDGTNFLPHTPRARYEVLPWVGSNNPSVPHVRCKLQEVLQQKTWIDIPAKKGILLVGALQECVVKHHTIIVLGKEIKTMSEEAEQWLKEWVTKDTRKHIILESPTDAVKKALKGVHNLEFLKSNVTKEQLIKLLEQGGKQT